MSTCGWRFSLSWIRWAIGCLFFMCIPISICVGMIWLMGKLTSVEPAVRSTLIYFLAPTPQRRGALAPRTWLRCRSLCRVMRSWMSSIVGQKGIISLVVRPGITLPDHIGSPPPLLPPLLIFHVSRQSPRNPRILSEGAVLQH